MPPPPPPPSLPSSSPPSEPSPTPHQDGWTALHIAARQGNADVIEQLIQEGASVLDVDGHGSTPLHVAAYHNRLEAVKKLVQLGADVRARNKSGFFGDFYGLLGYKPSDEARERGHAAVAEWLESVEKKTPCSSSRRRSDIRHNLQAALQAHVAFACQRLAEALKRLEPRRAARSGAPAACRAGPRLLERLRTSAHMAAVRAASEAARHTAQTSTARVRVGAPARSATPNARSPPATRTAAPADAPQPHRRPPAAERDDGAGAPAVESKFEAQTLVLGHASEAARGLNAALGLDDSEVVRYLLRGERAIVEEFEAHGSDEDLANLEYVLHGVACEAPLPAHIERQLQLGKYHGGELGPDDFDAGHAGMRFDDFVEHEHSRLANLQRPHVLALRLYTSTSYPCFNRPLRERQRPHPFKMSVYYLSEAIKKLRTVAATLDESYYNVADLWRGLRDMTVLDEFRRRGGTELAPMSTSRAKDVAFKYASSASPLVFNYKAQALSQGVAISYLSLYPKEREYLYPPLTYLSPPLSEGTERGCVVIAVTPQMP